MLVVTHHAGRNRSTPKHCPFFAALVGGLIVMAERWSDNADPPGFDAVGDNNACCSVSKTNRGDMKLCLHKGSAIILVKF